MSEQKTKYIITRCEMTNSYVAVEVVQIGTDGKVSKKHKLLQPADILFETAEFQDVVDSGAITQEKKNHE